jgi:hypothetical protein
MRSAEWRVRNLREEWLRRCNSHRRLFGERQVRQGGLDRRDMLFFIGVINVKKE